MYPITYPITDFTGTEFKLLMAQDCKILEPTIYLKDGNPSEEYQVCEICNDGFYLSFLVDDMYF